MAKIVTEHIHLAYEVAEQHCLQQMSKEKAVHQLVLSGMNAASAEMKENAGADFRKKTIARVYSHYCARLKESNALDFDDILLLTVKIFEDFPEALDKFRNRYKYILVDEYQDTNQVQFRRVNSP